MFHMRSLKALLAALLVSSSALAADEPSCRQTAGADQSAAYVEQCLLVSPATNPPCNADNPCALIVGEIKRSCGLIRQSMQGRPAQAAEEGGEPAFCKLHLGN
jgi:hypothetical protein